jgi:hypothetical protein
MHYWKVEQKPAAWSYWPRNYCKVEIMDKSSLYEIRVEGHLTDRWTDWFEGLAIRNEPNGETRLSGLLADQAALFGVLNKIQALNLTLVSVSRLALKG